MLNKKALAGTPSTPPVYVEDVFSTYLYTGNGSTQTINNDIDLSTKGGLVWLGKRTTDNINLLADTVRGNTKYLTSYTTDAEATATTRITSFNSNGFSLGNSGLTNTSADYVSWTFRKQEKFFDVVTYTGNGTSGRTVSHNLGSVPGMMIIKRTSGDPIEWVVYHRSLDATSPQNYYLRLNTTAARALQSGNFNNTAPTSSVFTLGDSGAVNTNGETYVAYLFAHDAGGFGTAGTDNVISCGSYTGNGSSTGPSINLGYEPQLLLIKSTSANDWILIDNMRGFPVSGETTSYLNPNRAFAESTFTTLVAPNATGFQPSTTDDTVNGSSVTYIYMAIRRPMKTPTSGTEVYTSIARTGTGSTATISGVGFAPDTLIPQIRNDAWGSSITDRLRQKFNDIYTTGAESSTAGKVSSWNMDGVTVGDPSEVNTSGKTYINHFFRRAPGFFDIVCYTGTGSATTVTHNLGVAPELMIVKKRNATGQWAVYSQATGNTNVMYLEESGPTESKPNMWNSTTPTASVFSIGTEAAVNTSAATYVAYLFATCAGVSKVGSYTGTGATQTINCGFTGGARFVLIKRTDFTGSYSSNPWYVWDTARGIVSGNDPYLLLNSTAAEVTNTDYIDPVNSGFEISSTAPAAINANGGSFIFLAIS